MPLILLISADGGELIPIPDNRWKLISWEPLIKTPLFSANASGKMNRIQTVSSEADESEGMSHHSKKSVDKLERS